MSLNMNVGAFVVLLGLSVGLPLSQLSETVEQPQFRPLPVSMSMAVEAAEAVTSGQALNALLGITEDHPVYEIYVLGINLSLIKVQVDALDGEVVVGVGEEQGLRKIEQIVQPDQGGAI
jgi:hypothetical protein